MNSETKKYFEGRICTIFTVGINRDYKQENPKTYPKQLYEYFMGLVVSCEEYGLLLQNLRSKTKSFFFYNQIIGICEEEIIDPDSPEGTKFVEEIKQAKTESIKKLEGELSKTKTSNTSFLDVDKFDKYA